MQKRWLQKSKDRAEQNLPYQGKRSNIRLVIENGPKSRSDSTNISFASSLRELKKIGN